MSISKLKLDRLDQEILNALQRNARLSSAELAEIVNLSASPCWRRVKRLEETSVIRGYHADIDYEKLGYAITAYVQVSLMQKDLISMTNFEQSVITFEEVVACHCISGSYDYQLTIMAPDLAHFNEFMRQYVNSFKGLKDVCTSFVMRQIKAPVKLRIK